MEKLIKIMIVAFLISIIPWHKLFGVYGYIFNVDGCCFLLACGIYVMYESGRFLIREFNNSRKEKNKAHNRERK